MSWLPFVFGWPSAVLGLAAFGLAFLTPHSWLGFVGAAVAVPFCLDVSRYPLFDLAGYIALMANCLSAYFLHRGRREVAFACLVPMAIICTVLLVFAFRHITLIAR